MEGGAGGVSRTGRLPNAEETSCSLCTHSWSSHGHQGTEKSRHASPSARQRSPSQTGREASDAGRCRTPEAASCPQARLCRDAQVVEELNGLHVDVDGALVLHDDPASWPGRRSTRNPFALSLSKCSATNEQGFDTSARTGFAMWKVWFLKCSAPAGQGSPPLPPTAFAP